MRARGVGRCPPGCVLASSTPPCRRPSSHVVTHRSSRGYRGGASAKDPPMAMAMLPRMARGEGGVRPAPAAAGMLVLAIAQLN
jgi:hypothetical protein